MCKKSNNWISADSWEVLIIGLCILLLLFGVATFVIKQWWLTPETQRIEVVLVPHDSLRTTYVYDKESLDSLVSNINARVSANEAKYETLSDAQEDERFKSLASMLIGIVSSIALFFGYKSFRDIREKGEETSRNVAKETADHTAKNAAKEYLDSKLPDIVKTELNNGLYNKEVIDSTKASIIAEIKPELLRELKDEIKHQHEEGKQQEKGKALSSDEMFGASQAFSLPEKTNQTGAEASDAAPTQTSKPKTDGKD